MSEATDSPRAGMIIVRTHVFGERERSLLRRLGALDGYRIAIAADETRKTLDVGAYEKISITRDACEREGLFCTSGFTWRNGDYALYLARKAYKEIDYFWIIEPDVEHSFRDDAALFSYFDKYAGYDLLAPYFNVSAEGWWWEQTSRVYKTGVKRALFCFVRMSARAVDVCLKARKHRRYSVRDRLCWPNDEVFVATEVVHAGLRAADLNDFDAPVYSLSSLCYDKPLNGAFLSREGDRIYHPVLYGEEFESRATRLHGTRRSDRLERWARKAQKMI